MDFKTKKQRWENFYSLRLKEFNNYLDWIEKKVKENKLDEAWYIANRGLVKLPRDIYFMMYYQMSKIRKKEKNFSQALFLFGLVIHFLGGLGGISHDKYLDQLLKKLDLQNRKKELLNIFLSKNPKEIQEYLSTLIKI